MKTGKAALVLLAVASAASSEPPPEVARAPQGLVLRRIPPILADAVVARQLDTGLTTTVALTVVAGRAGARALKGEAQVRIRYDLWDERYLMERWDAQRSPATATVARPELAGWWRELTLLVLPAASLPPSPPPAKVTVLVLPFSQAEQRDAQEWLLRSLRTPETSGRREGGGAGARAPSERAPLRDFYGAMLASSVAQRSLITYEWTVPVTAWTP